MSGMTLAWTAWAAVLAPAGAAAVLTVAPGRLGDRLAGWVALGGTLAALAFAGLLLSGSVTAAAGLRTDALAGGLATLAAGLAAAEALCLARSALPRLQRALVPATLAGTLLALLAGPPSLAWIGLATAAAAGLLSGRVMLLPAAAGLGLAGLGVALLQAPGGRAVGFVLLLAGCGLLAMTQAALAVPAVALVLRGQGLVEAGAGPPLLAVGLGLIAAAALASRTDRAGLTGLAAAGPGLALFAFGLGGPAAAAAGLLSLAASCLAQGAAAAQPQPRWLRAANLAALAGLPPFGVFAGWVMVLTETARRAPPLCLPLGAGLAACAWTMLRQPPDPLAGPPDPLRSASAGLQLAALAALGLGLLPGAQAWLAAAAP